MKLPSAIRRAGPYVCESQARGTILVRPTWPTTKVYGPGLISRLELAAAIEELLNEATTKED